MNKKVRLLLAVISMVLGISVCAFADSKPVVMEVLDDGANPSVYVKGIEGDVQSATALIGNTECKDVTFDTFEKSNITLDTLIMIDNSLSVPQASRDAAKSLIADFIADRKPYERFSIATYGEQLETVIDFTDDYKSLKSALEGIEYRDRETYLTDVLYELVDSDSFKENSEGSYRRILVVSDGVDNKDVGITSKELIDVLKKEGIPVYSMGAYNSKKSNGDELSNMFAISRTTNAASAIIGTDETNALFDDIRLDRDIVRFKITVADELKDGKEKTIKLSFNAGGEKSVTVDNVRMAQIAEKKSKEAAPTVEAKEEPAPVPEAEPELSFFEKNRMYIIYAGIGLAVILIIVIVLVLLSANKKKEDKNKIIEGPDIPMFPPVDDKTVFLGNVNQNMDSDGETVMIFGENRQCRIRLQDVHSPAYSFEMPIDNKLLIGRSANKGAMMIIDYDKSISGVHCSIEKRGSEFIVRDERSSNGTFLNNIKVPETGTKIISGQILKLGRTEFEFQVKF